MDGLSCASEMAKGKYGDRDAVKELQLEEEELVDYK